MKRGKREMRRNYKGRTALVALVLIFCCTVGGTLAWLATSTEDVVNTFTPGEVDSEVHEVLDGSTKRNVQIENTGNVDAYIRAAIVVNWVAADGTIYGEAPVRGTDYTLQTDSYWFQDADGYYYYPNKVGAKQLTSEEHYLIKSCTPVANEAPDGCNLQVTILADAIQADGVSNGKPVVETVWTNIKVNANGTLTVF